jgi:hypothetical protein
MSLVIYSQHAELMASGNSFKALNSHKIVVYVYYLHT